ARSRARRRVGRPVGRRASARRSDRTAARRSRHARLAAAAAAARLAAGSRPVNRPRPRPQPQPVDDPARPPPPRADTDRPGLTNEKAPANRGPFAGRTGFSGQTSVLARRRLSALASGGLLLSGRAALARARARGRGMRLLAPATRRAGRVRDPCRALLRHPLFLQLLVLFLVLDVRSFVRHVDPLSDWAFPGVPLNAVPKQRMEDPSFE